MQTFSILFESFYFLSLKDGILVENIKNKRWNEKQGYVSPILRIWTKIVKEHDWYCNCKVTNLINF